MPVKKEVTFSLDLYSGVSLELDLHPCRLVPRGDAGEILGDSLVDVESVVASIHEARGRSIDVISSGAIDGDGDQEQIREVGDSEVVGDSNDVVDHRNTVGRMAEDGDAEGVLINNFKGCCWTRR